MVYDPKGKKYEDMSPDRREQLKGAIITPIGFGKDHPKENWDITAEISGANKPFTEIISNGKKNEIGKHGTKKLGEQITTYMVRTSQFLSSFGLACSYAIDFRNIGGLGSMS